MDIKGIFELIFAVQKANAVRLGLEFDLFEILKTPRELNFIVSKLNANERNAKIFLDALVFLGLIKIDENLYQNSELANKIFVSSSPLFCKDMFLFNFKRQLGGVRNLQNFISTNAKNKLDGFDKWSNHFEDVADLGELNTVLMQSQKLKSDQILSVIEGAKEFKNVRKILDMGCGAAAICLELAKRHEKLEITLLDFEDTLKQTAKNVEAYGLSERVKFISGDAKSCKFNECYDMVFCGNLFYFIDDIKALMDKIYTILSDDGIFVSVHTQISYHKRCDLDSFFYFFLFSLEGSNSLKNGTLQRILKKANFKNLQTVKLKDMPPANLDLIIARK